MNCELKFLFIFETYLDKRHKRAMMFESQKGISLYVVTRHGADSVPGNISRNLETNLSH